MGIREIIFRGKSIDENNKGEWKFGFYRHFVTDRYNKHYIDSIGQNLTTTVDINTLGQYTGLKDKNGTKIFEGDLLRFPAINKFDEVNFVSYEVFYHDNDSCIDHVGFQMNRLNYHGSLCGGNHHIYTFKQCNTSQMVVIGNIHDKDLKG